jgi:hypothetical protein
MSEMVERVIDSMLATDLDVTLWKRETVRELAVAAVQAMREPTRDMRAAADYAHKRSVVTNGTFTHEGCYRAMISAALAEVADE